MRGRSAPPRRDRRCRTRPGCRPRRGSPRSTRSRSRPAAFRRATPALERRSLVHHVSGQAVPSRNRREPTSPRAFHRRSISPDVPSHRPASCTAKPCASASNTCAMSIGSPAEQTRVDAPLNPADEDLTDRRTGSQLVGARFEVGERTREHHLREFRIGAAEQPEHRHQPLEIAERIVCLRESWPARRPAAGSLRRTSPAPGRPCRRTARTPRAPTCLPARPPAAW